MDVGGNAEQMQIVIGYYSLIQYVPDLARREGANVGVVLFVPDPHFVGVLISPDNECPKQRFGPDAIDDDFLNFAKTAITNRLLDYGKAWRGWDDLRDFARREGNSLQMTTSPTTALVDSLELDKALEALYRDLVSITPKRVVGSSVRE